MAKILVIDDNKVLLTFAAECLRTDGHQVLTAENGEQGLALAEMEKPDLVVTDVMMPGMFGFGVVNALRANPAFAATRIIVSSLNFHGDIQSAKSVGADRFVPKPCSPEALIRMVAELLGS